MLKQDFLWPVHYGRFEVQRQFKQESCPQIRLNRRVMLLFLCPNHEVSVSGFANVEIRPEMETLKGCKVKRRRRGKKRSTAAAVAVAAAAAAVAGGVPSKSGDDSSELESEALFSPPKQAASRSRQASLRPVVVPKAPENSTQFLIDDHENSALFLNFEKNYESPSWCMVGMPAPGDTSDPSDDDHYYMRDFESEYENAKEQVLLDWPRETLFSEILRLEARAHSLEHSLDQMLILQNPRDYINKLQEQLLDLQDENERLRASIRAASSGSVSRSSHDVDSSGASGATSSDDDGLRRPGRRRADTASDLVMVVAPLSLRDPDASAGAPGENPVAAPRQLPMELA